MSIFTMGIFLGSDLALAIGAGLVANLPTEGMLYVPILGYIYHWQKLFLLIGLQIGQAAYAASKGGIVSLTLPAAWEFAQFGIRVNAIAPGLFMTPLLEGLNDEAIKNLSAAIPFPKRVAGADEFAKLVLHIIDNNYINGEVIRIDGALRSMQPK